MTVQLDMAPDLNMDQLVRFKRLMSESPVFKGHDPVLKGIRHGSCKRYKRRHKKIMSRKYLISYLSNSVICLGDYRYD